MSILLDIGEDLVKLSNAEGLIYKDITLNNSNKKRNLYILIQEDDIKLIDLDIEDDVVEFQDKLKLVFSPNMNKSLLTSGKYKKQNMSISPLAINFNVKTIRDKFGDNWEEILTEITNDGFDIIQKSIDKEDEVLIRKNEQLKEFCDMALSNNITKLIDILTNATDEMTARILFDIDMEYYKQANKFFYYSMNKLFANIKEVVEYDNETYGYNSFICTNSKKPFLLSKIRNNKKDIYNISFVGNIQKPFKLNEILSYRTKKIDNENVYYYEYDTKEPETNIKKNNYIGKDKLKAIGKATVWQLEKYFQGKEISINDYYKRIFNIDVITKNNLKTIETIIIKKMIKDLRTEPERKKVIDSLNILFSIKNYYKFEKEDIMDTIKRLQETDDIQINNDREFSYLLGQTVYYVNSFSIESKERGTMGYIYKYITNTNKITDNLIRDMKKYKRDIGRTKLFSQVVSELMKYKYKKLDKSMFLAGVLDTNIFYQKQVKEENTNNETEEI